jgi:hypothetical protein
MDKKMTKKLGNNPLKGIDSIVRNTQDIEDTQSTSLPSEKQNILKMPNRDNIQNTFSAHAKLNTEDASSRQNTSKMPNVDNIQSISSSCAKLNNTKNKELPKMSLALQPEAMAYVQLMSGVKTISMTQYINKLIFEDMKQNADLYNQLKKLIKS